jgi:hypothetical protein
MLSQNQASSQLLDLTCVLSEGNRLAIESKADVWSELFGSNADVLPVLVEVYEYIILEGEGTWQMIGNTSSPNSCPDANQSDLATKACYYDAVLSGNGQVLVIGTSIVHNDNYDDATMAITTYVWNATIGDWGVMENEGGSMATNHNKPHATTWQEKCIALSDDGTVLAVCSELGIAVYSWSVDNSAWMPRHIDLDIAVNSTSLTG